MKKAKLIAVFDDDIDSLLKSLGVYDSFYNGEEKCVICDTVINRENFQAILPRESEIKFCCDNPKCYFQIIKEKG